MAPTNHTLVICKSTNRTTANRQQVVTDKWSPFFIILHMQVLVKFLSTMHEGYPVKMWKSPFQITFVEDHKVIVYIYL